MSLTFGDFIRERRLALGKNLHEFCSDNELNASDYAELERGIRGPEIDRLREYACYLGIDKNSKDWATLCKLAHKYWNIATQRRTKRSILSENEQESAIKIFQMGYKQGYEDAWSASIHHVFSDQVKYIGHCPPSNLDHVRSTLIHGFKKEGYDSDIELAEKIENLWGAMKE